VQPLRFTVFGTLVESMRVLRRNLVPVVVLGLLFFSPLILYTGSLMRDVARDGWISSDAITTWLLVTTLLAYAADQLTAAPIVYGVVQELNGTHAGIGACLAQGLKRLASVFVTVLLLYLCVLLGAYPFIIPAFVLAAGLYVAVPVAVCERPGIAGTLTRSFTLTEGNRMRIFGMMILYWGGRLGAKFGLIFGLRAEGRVGLVEATLGGALAIDFLFGIVGAVMQGVTYSRLRQLKDGVSTADLAAVFE